MIGPLPPLRDPRWMFAVLHTAYVVVGHVVLDFQRSGLQLAVAILGCSLLDALYTFARSRTIVLPLSGYITGLGLAILLSSPGRHWTTLLAVWLAISSKHLLRIGERHLWNPSNFAIVVLLVFLEGRVAVAPAYQWSARPWVLAVLLVAGSAVVYRSRRWPLVATFVAVYAAGALVRTWWVQTPLAVGLWSQVSGGAFWLFTFAMITDPKTSPQSPRAQALFGLVLGLVDAAFQFRFEVFSSFYALFLVCPFFVLGELATGLRVPPERAEGSQG